MREREFKVRHCSCASGTCTPLRTTSRGFGHRCISSTQTVQQSLIIRKHARTQARTHTHARARTHIENTHWSARKLYFFFYKNLLSHTDGDGAIGGCRRVEPHSKYKHDGRFNRGKRTFCGVGQSDSLSLVSIPRLSDQTPLHISSFLYEFIFECANDMYINATNLISNPSSNLLPACCCPSRDTVHTYTGRRL